LAWIAPSCFQNLQNSYENIDWCYILFPSIQNGGGYALRNRNLIVESIDEIWFKRSWMDEDKIWVAKHD